MQWTHFFNHQKNIERQLSAVMMAMTMMFLLIALKNEEDC